MIDPKEVAEQARKEIREEVTKEAVEKLKGLYLRKEKAELVAKNIEREIANYLADLDENATYAAAGVETAKA